MFLVSIYFTGSLIYRYIFIDFFHLIDGDDKIAEPQET